MLYSNKKIKRLLKAELVKRGVKISDLVELLNQEGLNETKSSVTSKISRGTFSAAFFMQCLSVIGCTKLEIETYPTSFSIAAEPMVEYKSNSDDK